MKNPAAIPPSGDLVKYDLPGGDSLDLPLSYTTEEVNRAIDMHQALKATAAAQGEAQASPPEGLGQRIRSGYSALVKPATDLVGSGVGQVLRSLNPLEGGPRTLRSPMTPEGRLQSPFQPLDPSSLYSQVGQGVAGAAIPQTPEAAALMAAMGPISRIGGAGAPLASRPFIAPAARLGASAAVGGGVAMATGGDFTSGATQGLVGQGTSEATRAVLAFKELGSKLLSRRVSLERGDEAALSMLQGIVKDAPGYAHSGLGQQAVSPKDSVTALLNLRDKNVGSAALSLRFAAADNRLEAALGGPTQPYVMPTIRRFLNDVTETSGVSFGAGKSTGTSTSEGKGTRFRTPIDPATGQPIGPTKGVESQTLGVEAQRTGTSQTASMRRGARGAGGVAWDPLTGKPLETTPVTVREALRAIKEARRVAVRAMKAGEVAPFETLDAMRDELLGIAAKRNSGVAKMYREEMANYHRGKLIEDILDSAGAFEGRRAARGSGPTFDSKSALNYMLEHYREMGHTALPETWKSLLRGAKPGARDVSTNIGGERIYASKGLSSRIPRLELEIERLGETNTPGLGLRQPRPAFLPRLMGRAGTNVASGYLDDE